MITAEEFAKQMKAIAEGLDKSYDEEIAHISADALMMETLMDLGYGVGVDIFANMHKWYA